MIWYKIPVMHQVTYGNRNEFCFCFFHKNCSIVPAPLLLWRTKPHVCPLTLGWKITSFLFLFLTFRVPSQHPPTPIHRFLFRAHSKNMTHDLTWLWHLFNSAASTDVCASSMHAKNCTRAYPQQQLQQPQRHIRELLLTVRPGGGR